MKSPVRYLNDSQYAALPLHERALHVARSQVGQTEVRPNWSPMIAIYLRAVGLDNPAPWCAAFATWCWLQAGAKRARMPRNAASCRAWCKHARANGLARPSHRKPKRGDLIAYYDRRGLGHIMLVAEMIGANDVRTLEGNTNAAGSREGIAVMVRNRALDDLMMLPNVTVIDGALLARFAS